MQMPTTFDPIANYDDHKQIGRGDHATVYEADAGWVIRVSDWVSEIRLLVNDGFHKYLTKRPVYHPWLPEIRRITYERNPWSNHVRYVVEMERLHPYSPTIHTTSLHRQFGTRDPHYVVDSIIEHGNEDTSSALMKQLWPSVVEMTNYGDDSSPQNLMVRKGALADTVVLVDVFGFWVKSP